MNKPVDIRVWFSVGALFGYLIAVKLPGSWPVLAIWFSYIICLELKRYWEL